MNKNMYRAVCATLVLVLCGLGSARAGETEVHGYGYQGYLKSSDNNYLDAKRGTYDFNNIALLVSNKVEDRTTIWIQVFGNSKKFGLDWAYVDYQVRNDLSVRAGQIKFPIGLFNEIRDNKLLHLAMMEPIMYREESDIIFEAYRGVGINYNGPVTVDVFGGAPLIESEDPALKNEVRGLLGGRIVYKTPLEGLKVMGSYASFKEQVNDATTGATVIPEGREAILLLSASYEHHGLEVNVEYAKKKNIEGDFLSGYVEAGYTFFEKLTPFVRYDELRRTGDGVDKSDPANYQQELVAGIGYKLNPYFGIKAEEHMMRGYLLPAITNETPAGTGKRDWDMFVAGINFMF